jgi:hypothetical protein
MPPKVFISYDNDDATRVSGFRGLSKNPHRSRSATAPAGHPLHAPIGERRGLAYDGALDVEVGAGARGRDAPRDRRHRSAADPPDSG